jgi:hypothetical protein
MGGEFGFWWKWRNIAVVFWLGSLTWQEKIRLIPVVWVDFNLLDPTMLALS